MSIFEKISNAIAKAFAVLNSVIVRTNTIATKYGPQLRGFVMDTAEELEKAIPDGGFGNLKLMMFDGALKVFVDAMKEQGELKEGELSGIYEFAHFLLEGYLAAKKATASVVAK